jgi:hypothetical protein
MRLDSTPRTPDTPHPPPAHADNHPVAHNQSPHSPKLVAQAKIRSTDSNRMRPKIKKKGKGVGEGGRAVQGHGGSDGGHRESDGGHGGLVQADGGIDRSHHESELMHRIIEGTNGPRERRKGITGAAASPLAPQLNPILPPAADSGSQASADASQASAVHRRLAQLQTTPTNRRPCGGTGVRSAHRRSLDRRR